MLHSRNLRLRLMVQRKLAAQCTTLLRSDPGQKHISTLKDPSTRSGPNCSHILPYPMVSTGTNSSDAEGKAHAGLYSKKIVWLYGPPGVGKFGIANTIAKTVRQQGLNPAGFFCKGGDSSRSSEHKIFPTLSSQLIRLLPGDTTL